LRYQGRITTWKDDKGFGFITPNGGGEPVFVHISSFSNGQRRPRGKEIVVYQLQADGKGRTQAHGVSFAGQRPSITGRRERSGRSTIPYFFAAGFLLAVTAAVALGRLPVALLLVYLGASLIAFLAYALDKSAAKQNRWRTPESTLHLLALIGGWPGALAAQCLLRHKSAKTSFQVMFWLTVLLNCGAFIWLLGPAGAPMLRTLSDVM
jgi:uncharacterized membrane protein YsdA (DUF1294 family)/cold shock CspA family protein